MEYLTIKDHHRNHFRGMESINHNRYDAKAVEAVPRPLIPPSEPRLTPPISSRSDEDATSWSQKRTHGVSLLNSPHLPPPTLFSGYSHPASTTSAPSVSLNAGSESRSDRLPADLNDWGRPTQAPSTRNSMPTAEASMEREEPKPFKLPSFNSLVEQLERKLEPIATSGAESTWNGRDTSSGFSPLEPTPYLDPTGRPRSSTGVQQIANSEPTSPHAYSSQPYSMTSPRLRAARPQYRTHSRRSSDHRNRAYSHVVAPSPREAPVVPFPGSHHRTQTFPSFPPHPAIPSSSSGYKSTPFQHSLPPQPLAAEIMPYPGGIPRHAPIAPATSGPGYGHSRNDSVLASTEDYRFHSSTFYANGNSAGHHQRKRRGNLPKDATKILRQWFDEHKDAPYPGEEVKAMLCHQTGLQMSQVNNWFINARRRLPRSDLPRKDRESTEGSDGTPSRDQGHKLNHASHEYWR